MRVTGLMVLPPDVLILPVSKLAPGIRRRLGKRAKGFVVTRSGARSASRLVDGGTARLLQRFREPARVVDAVLDHSRVFDLDPKALLVEAYPVIRDCLEHHLLAPADSPEARRIEPTLEGGDRVGQLVIVRCVRALEDTELYQARDRRGTVVALKLLRPRAAAAVRRLLRREADVLERLDGVGVPRLIARGRFENRPYLVLSWRAGVSPLVAAAELRGGDAPRARQRLLGLCAEVADAYARLHAHGVIHADVHPGNLLVESSGRISIVDFALARCAPGNGTRPTPPRQGVDFFLEPECAKALLAGRSPPPPSARGEQYSVAALLYLLATGEYYADFPLHRRELLSRVVEARVLPFARRGTAPWPALEAVLARALARDPSQRFASMADFAAALRLVRLETARPRARRGPTIVRASPRRGLLRDVLFGLRTPDRLFARGLPAPTCSVNLGAAGIALALYRIACIRGDAGMLSAADAWITSAQDETGAATAFADPVADITPRTVGRISPYHTEAGVWAVRALISQAAGDKVGMEAAATAFVTASRRPCEVLDLTLGRTGTLLGCALLLDALHPALGSRCDALRSLGCETMDTVVRALKRRGPIAACTDLPVLGLAHGWAGALYATLRWCRSTNVAVPAVVGRRLTELARLGEPAGRGMQWPRIPGGSRPDPERSHVASWCGGTAGFVHLWTTAATSLGRDDFLGLAELSAWNVWEARRAAPNLCCGLAGRAYALINLYKHTGERSWLRRAQELADRAALAAAGPAADHGHPLSLYRGRVGIAVLAADLDQPETASMPFFEDEGWPPHASP